MIGKIKNVGTTYGFIASEDDNQDYYFRTLNIEKGSSGKITKGDRVEFDSIQNEKGRPEAIKIRLVENPIPESGLEIKDESPAKEVIRQIPQEAAPEGMAFHERVARASSSTLHGEVDYFDNGEGYIKAEGGIKYGASYVNIRDQQGYKVLYPTEEVVFEQHPKMKVALNIRLVTRPLVRGTIVEFDEEEGIIEADDTHKKFHFLGHYINHKQYWEYEAGDRVKFRPVPIEGKECGVRVSWIDKRKPLERFADLSRFWPLLDKLAHMTDEDWDFRVRPTGGLPILENYLFYTFKRVEQQKKILTVEHSKSGKWMASFNTGLATPQQQEIFRFF